MTQIRSLIIVPTYNEAENLELLISAIQALNAGLEILVVDDNSPDGTGEIADRLCQELPGIHVLHRAGKMGLGTAYVEGFEWAIEQNYDCVFEMDCDFSHDPKYLPTFLTEIASADLVIGSRYIKGGGTPNWGILRKLISWGGNAFARMMLGIKVHDCTGGFRCYRREILEKVPGCRVSADQAYREADLAIDFCEDVPRLPPEDINAIVRCFEAAGARAKVSSIHVNGWFGDYDKLTMTRLLFEEAFHCRLDEARQQVIFIGDSPNDSPMFAYFPHGVGVANVSQFKGQMTHYPTWVTKREGGYGFAEMVEGLMPRGA